MDCLSDRKIWLGAPTVTTRATKTLRGYRIMANQKLHSESHNCQLKAIAGHARWKTIYALTRYNSWKGTTTMDDKTKRGIEYLRGIVESGKVLRLGEPHVSGNFNYWHYFLAGGPLIPWPIFACLWQMWGIWFSSPPDSHLLVHRQL